MGFECLNCGGKVRYDIATGQVICEHCNRVYAEEEYAVYGEQELVKHEDSYKNKNIVDSEMTSSTGETGSFHFVLH